MWNLLKKIFKPESHNFSPTETEPSIDKLVSFNSLNKRKNIRIKYPHFGAFGAFPRIFYMNSEMIVGNLSAGGLFIIDDTEKFGDEVGKIVMLEMVWDDFSTKVRARLVGANLQRRHLQFVDFNAQAFLRISKLTKPAYLGSRFHQVHDKLGKLDTNELWIGPTGESLSFPKSGVFAELTLNGQKMKFKRGQPTLFEINSRPVAQENLNEILIALANFPQNSPRIKELLEILEVELRSLSPRKTG